MAESFCLRVFGTVQGVYFRHSARIEAERLGLRGHARNLPDGSVEVMASGAASDLAQLRAWLAHGPPQARVERIEEAGAVGRRSIELTDEFRVL